jgi:hypothetical protein
LYSEKLFNQLPYEFAMFGQKFMGKMFKALKTNIVIDNILRNCFDNLLAGHIEASCEPHAARGPCVCDARSSG